MSIKTMIGCTVLSAAMLTTAVSCKKKDDSPTCRMTTATSVSGTDSYVYSLTYNNDGKISTITTVGGGTTTSKVFTYAGNTINIAEKNNSGTVTYNYVVTLNSAGNISSIVQTAPGSSNTYTLTAAYDGNGNLTSITSQSSGSSAYVTNTTYSGGDLVSYSAGGSNSGTLEYYSDKDFQDGDYFKTQQMLQYGALYIVNKHLVKAQTSGSNITNYSYEFTDGRVSKLTSSASGGSVSTVTYQYTCN